MKTPSAKSPALASTPRRFRSRALAAPFFAAASLSGLLLAGPGPVSAADEERHQAAPNDNIEDHAELGRGDAPRSVEDIARDGTENPAAIARFAGVAPYKKVLELRARDGYLTEVLALAAYPYGKVIANNDPAGLDPADAEAWTTRLDKPVFSDTARLDQGLDQPLPIYAIGVDIVVSAAAYSDAIRRGIDAKAMNAAVMGALAPGGLYVIVDAAAAKGAAASDAAALCRISEDQVRREVEAAGFRFVEAGKDLADAGDPRSASACRPGSGSQGKQVRIDRFLLKFEKPQAAPPAAGSAAKPLPALPGLPAFPSLPGK